MIGALAIALLVTLAVAIVGWFRPLSPKPPAPPTYNTEKVAVAKTKILVAFEKVHQAVQGNSARDQGSKPNQRLLAAVTAQQALVAETVYLQTTLAEEAAAPNDLKLAIQNLAVVDQSLMIDFLNWRGSPKVDPWLRAGDEATTVAIQGICK